MYPCTRCVRFLTEVAGSFDFGVIGRGSYMEIGTFIEKHVFNELFSTL
jgi:NADH-quinone oxidoreductase subunit G